MGLIQAVLWDMDGTLVDTERVAWRAMQLAFREAAGIALSEDLFNSLLGRSELDFYQHVAGQYGLSRALLASIQECFDNAYLPLLAQVPPLPGAVEKVREFAARAPQALVTGSSRTQADAVLTALDVGAAFLQIVASGNYRRGKPDPEPYLLAARQLGVAPEACLAIEDSPAGVASARAAGMKVAGVHAGNAGRYDISEADAEYSTLHELHWEALVGLLRGE
jgi:beta-phosphoglucomutase